MPYNILFCISLPRGLINFSIYKSNLISLIGMWDRVDIHLFYFPTQRSVSQNFVEFLLVYLIFYYEYQLYEHEESIYSFKLISIFPLPLIRFFWKSGLFKYKIRIYMHNIHMIPRRPNSSFLALDIISNVKKSKKKLFHKINFTLIL